MSLDLVNGESEALEDVGDQFNLEATEMSSLDARGRYVTRLWLKPEKALCGTIRTCTQWTRSIQKERRK